jgi:aspartyl-tRNA(Asn)/glutamyl-tRNA(Gln) amidotransferase subunit A
MRLAIPTTVAFDEIADDVAQAFERAVAKLAQQGAVIERIAVPEFADVAVLNAKGGFSGAEAWAWHRALIARRGADYDPRVIGRIRRGEGQSAADYVDLLKHRRAMIDGFDARVAPFDALVMPTVAITPPRIADLEKDDDAYAKANVLSLRNCTLINTIDGCAITLPIQREGEAPVGLMLAASGGADRRIFELAAGIESAVRG